MQLVKSPLNYTGNKYRIIDQMRRHFPENIKCMVDLFCGGATVGLNTNAKKIIFVDSNERIINLLVFLSKQDFDAFIKKCESIIEKYGLSYSPKYGYRYYRDMCNDTNANNGLKDYNSKGFYTVSYEFSPGPFAKLVKKAYTNPDKMFYLVIEEVNRGNAPAIFGDVFQLLDRQGQLIRDQVSGQLTENPTITYVRKLKAVGVEVYFEKENLWSLDDKTEFLLTIMASIAQEESRSISQNVTLGKRWSMKEGRVSFAYKNFLGYKKVDGKIVIDEEQAEIVRLIYRMFLKEGKTCSGIAEYLKSKGIPTPSGKNTNWTKNNIYSILRNEKYKGDALLQKTYTADYLEHKLVPNKGELPQYYVENNHPAIIEREIWEMVQTEMMRRSLLGAAYSGGSVFVSKVICGDCGTPYGKKKWHSTDKYARIIYRCNAKYSKEQPRCQTPHFTEEEIKERFIKAYNLVMCDKQQVINDTLAVIEMLMGTDELDLEIAERQARIEEISKVVSAMVRENARTVQDQIEFARRYDELTKQYDEHKAALDKAVKEKAYKTGKATQMRVSLEAMKQADDFLAEWSDEMWILMVEVAVVNRDKTITFRFINGKEVTV